MFRQWDSAFLRVIEHRWPAPVLREDIRTSKSKPTQTDRSPLSQHLHRRSPRTMEDTKTGVPKLLVASDI